MSRDRQPISTSAAPAAIGPYSQAVANGGLLFCSGQIALDAEGREIGADAAAQAEQCLLNLRAVCEAASADLSRAVKVTVYLEDMADFEAVNAVYARFFEHEPPARAAVAVAGLPRGRKVEIDAIVPIGGE